jgi:integrase/recombinase XerD
MQVITPNEVKKHPAFTPEQVKQLIMTAGDIRRMTLMLVAYKTGLRRSELFNLTIDDIDIDNNRINVKIRKGGKKGLYAFFDDEAKNYLQAYLKIRKSKNPQERQLFLDAHGYKITQLETLSNIIEPVIAVSPFKEVTMHSFRHFFTSHLNMNRIHPKALQVLRGDSNRGMIDYYTEVTEEWVKAEYLKCIPKLNLPVLRV